MQTAADSVTSRAVTGSLRGRPAWSPDGRTIAYTSLGNRPGIYTMNANGGQIRRVTKTISGIPHGRRTEALSPLRLTTVRFRARESVS